MRKSEIKKSFVILAVLGMAAVSSGGAVSPGFSEDFESYSLGSLPGQGPWVTELGGGDVGDGPALAVNVVPEGIGPGPKALGYASDHTFHGAGIEITGADSGVIDINFVLFNSGRKNIWLEGDSAQGNYTNYIWLLNYQHYALEDTDYRWNQWSVRGWLDTPAQVKYAWSDPGMSKTLILPRDPQELNIRLDFENDTLGMRYRDVNDSSYVPTGGPWIDIIPMGTGALPFDSLTYFGINRNMGPLWCDNPPNAAEGYMDNFSITSVGPPAPPLWGDFDEDGDVDGVDFFHWQIGYPTSSGATLDSGDADGDGDTDGIDFGLWQGNYPTAPVPASASALTPEPATLGLLMIGGLTLLSRRRKTRGWFFHHEDN